MSDVIGPVFLGGQTEVFIAKDWGHQRNYSEEVAKRVDEEIRRILDEQFERARNAIIENREALERVVAALLEYERVDGDEFEKIFKGEQVEIETFSERRTRLETADPDVEAREMAEREKAEREEAERKAAEKEREADPFKW